MMRSRALPAFLPALLLLPLVACATAGALSGGAVAAGPCDGRPERDLALCLKLCNARPVDDRCLLVLRFGEPGWLALQDIRTNRRVPTEAARAQGMTDVESRRFLAWLQGTADVPIPPVPGRRVPDDRVDALQRQQALMGAGKASEDRKDPDAALEAYRQALEIARSDLGAFPEVAAATLARMATVLASGRAGEAADRLGEAISLRRSIAGADPTLLGVEMHNRAGYLLAAGRIEEAAEAFREAAVLNAAALGEEHPRTAFERSQRGRMLQRLGRPGEAADEFRAALRSHEAVQGPLHRETLALRVELGLALRAAHRAQHAAAELDPAVAGLERTMGPGHPKTLVAMNQWAGALKDAERLDEAIAIYRKALERARDLEGESREAFLSTLWDNLGVALAQATRHEEAREAQQKALEVAEQMGDPVHVEQCRGNLGVTLSELGRVDEARPHLEAALEAAARRHGAGSLEAGIAADNLGTLELKAGRTGTAAGLMRRALDAFVAADGPDSPHVAIAWTNLAHALWRQGQKRESLDAFDRCLAVAGSTRLPKRLHASAQANRAVLRLMLDGPEKALPDLQDALARAEAAVGPDDPLTGALRDAIADPGSVKDLLTVP